MNLRQSQSSEAEQSSHFSESDSHTSGERRRIKPPPPRGTRLGMGNVSIIAPPPAPRCAPSLPSRRETTLGLVAPVPAPSPVPHVPVKIGTPVLPPMTSTEIANVVAGVAMTPVVQKRTIGLEGGARKAPPAPVRNTLAHAPTMMRPMPPPPSARKGGTMIMTTSAPQTPPPAPSLEEHVDRVDPDGVRVVSMTRNGIPLSAADLRALRHHMPVVASTPTLFVDDEELIEENSQMKSFGQCSTNGPRQPQPAPTTKPELETLDPDDLLEQDDAAEQTSPRLATAAAAARKALTNTQPPAQTGDVTPPPRPSQLDIDKSVIVDPEKLQEQAQNKSARGLSYSSELQDELVRDDLERAEKSDMPIDQLGSLIYNAESKLTDPEVLPTVKAGYKRIYFVCADRLINTMINESNDRKGLRALSEAMQKRLERAEVLEGAHKVSQRIKEMCDQRIAQLPPSNPPAASASQTPAASPQPAPGRALSSKPPTKGGTVMIRQSPLPPPIQAARGSSHPPRLQFPSTPPVPAPGTPLPLAANGSGAPPAQPPRLSPPPPSSQRASGEGRRPLGTPPIPTGLDLGPVQVPPPPSQGAKPPASRQSPPAAPSSKPPAPQRVQEPPRPAATPKDVVMVAVPKQAGIPTTFIKEEVLLRNAKKLLQDVEDELTSVEDVRSIRDTVRKAMEADNPPSVEGVYGQVIAACAKRMQPSMNGSPLATPPTFPLTNTPCPPTAPMAATKEHSAPQPKTDGMFLYATILVLGVGIVWLALWTFHQKPESEPNQQNTSEQRNVGEH
ncbi:MAG: hypothetical protein KIH65_000020 [Candidatus Uhrbacteria bacterium]|nr:hypothetical protein [Candidatus Uhrbacteria bacterium]